MKNYLSRMAQSVVLFLAILFGLASTATATVVTSLDFSSPIPVSATQAPGVLYTDRYQPAVVDTSAGVLRLTTTSSESQSSRPSPFNTSFYNTQGVKYDVGPGVIVMSVQLYQDPSWMNSGERQAGFWSTGFDEQGLVDPLAIYGITEFYDIGYRAWDNGNWLSLGAGISGAFNTLEMALDTIGDKICYSLNGGAQNCTAGAGSANYWGNAMFQIYNNYGPNVNRTSRDAVFDNFVASDGNRIPEPGSLLLAGVSLLGLGIVSSRRKSLSAASTA